MANALSYTADTNSNTSLSTQLFPTGDLSGSGYAQYIVKNVGAHPAKFGSSSGCEYVLEPGEKLQFSAAEFQGTIRAVTTNDTTTVVALGSRVPFPEFQPLTISLAS